VTVQSTGIVQPRNRLEVKPPLAGRAEDVLVQEGQLVKKGQVLLWMSSSERAALIDAARARGPEEVKRWEEFYRATPVVSPIDGTVISRKLEPGQSFAASDALLVIADRLLVEAQVDETDIGLIRLRLPARIVLDAYPGESVPASVGALAYESKTVSNVTTYTVDVVPARIPALMRSGMTATVTFQIAAKDDVLRVPTHALRDDGGQKSVLVPGADGVPREQAVETGLSDGRQTEVISGLNEGDKVLVVQAKRDSKNPGGASPLSPQPRKKK
ncbi:MAG TPA: efflux RND transporter periplasmic adaptor subunit, partial [Acidiferrobacterales bacterium]|nr:efflux RND transporter periplasmic adaptor subunit [Acidiferrobacterales bacterium]